MLIKSFDQYEYVFLVIRSKIKFDSYSGIYDTFI